MFRRRHPSNLRELELLSRPNYSCEVYKSHKWMVLTYCYLNGVRKKKKHISTDMLFLQSIVTLDFSNVFLKYLRILLYQLFLVWFYIVSSGYNRSSFGNGEPSSRSCSCSKFKKKESSSTTAAQSADYTASSVLHVAQIFMESCCYA